MHIGDVLVCDGELFEEVDPEESMWILVAPSAAQKKTSQNASSPQIHLTIVKQKTPSVWPVIFKSDFDKIQDIQAEVAESSGKSAELCSFGGSSVIGAMGMHEDADEKVEDQWEGIHKNYMFYGFYIFFNCCHLFLCVCVVYLVFLFIVCIFVWFHI